MVVMQTTSSLFFTKYLLANIILGRTIPLNTQGVQGILKGWLFDERVLEPPFRLSVLRDRQERRRVRPVLRLLQPEREDKCEDSAHACR